eukprot:scaffold3071_cov253-Pinguiococcus_pyrenoidosus.AAC.2
MDKPSIAVSPARCTQGTPTDFCMGWEAPRNPCWCLAVVAPFHDFGISSPTWCICVQHRSEGGRPSQSFSCRTLSWPSGWSKKKREISPHSKKAFRTRIEDLSNSPEQRLLSRSLHPAACPRRLSRGTPMTGGTTPTLHDASSTSGQHS